MLGSCHSSMAASAIPWRERRGRVSAVCRRSWIDLGLGRSPKLLWGWRALRRFCRIEHQLAMPGMTAKARRESAYLQERFSGHSPLTIDDDFKI